MTTPYLRDLEDRLANHRDKLADLELRHDQEVDDSALHELRVRIRQTRQKVGRVLAEIRGYHRGQRDEADRAHKERADQNRAGHDVARAAKAAAAKRIAKVQRTVARQNHRTSRLRAWLIDRDPTLQPDIDLVLQEAEAEFDARVPESPLHDAGSD